MLHKHLIAALAAGLLFVTWLAPASAVPRWVPLPIAKSTAMNNAPTPGDATRGASIFAKCQACHEVDASAGHTVGPALQGILGRPAAAYKNFSYSRALAQAGKEGLFWTRDFLNEYLESPTKFLPEGAMAFVGLQDESERADLIAYLATLEAPEAAPWLFKNISRVDIPLPDRSPISR